MCTFRKRKNTADSTQTTIAYMIMISVTNPGVKKYSLSLDPQLPCILFAVKFVSSCININSGNPNAPNAPDKLQSLTK